MAKISTSKTILASFFSFYQSCTLSPLSKLVCDILAVPASSVTSERAFSGGIYYILYISILSMGLGRRVVTDTRCNLSEQTI